MTNIPPRTALGEAGAAIAVNRDLQDALRSAHARIADLEREVRDLRQQLAAANLCIGKRGAIDDGEFFDV